MKARCLIPSNAEYHNYGERGITICAEWRDNFAAFLAHVGRRPTPAHSIDRIDVERGYEPGNVRWATAKEQADNRRNNVYLTLHGVTRRIMEWAELTGLSLETLHSRRRLGWSDEQVLSEPLFSAPNTVLRNAGTRNPKAKFTEDDVREIRRRLGNGERGSDLAREKNVSQAAISSIVHRKTWPDIV